MSMTPYTEQINERFTIPSAAQEERAATRGHAICGPRYPAEQCPRE